MQLRLNSSRRLRLAAAFTTALVVSLLVLPPSQAVHDEAFDVSNADVDSDTTTDWVDLFDVVGSPTVTTPKASLPSGVTAAAFAKDWVLPDATGYATGSKDELPISLTGGGDWQCKTPNNLGDKFDLLNAYAAAYVPSGGDDVGDLIVYFGSEVSAPEGNRNMGVWLLQDPDVDCSGAGNTDFSGSHMDGDVFVVSAFTGGGNVANIDVYEWVDSTPLDNDADVGGSLVKKAGFTNVKCPSVDVNDDACAVSNTDGDKNSDEAAFEIDPPWDAPDKDGGNLNEAEFIEGGVNLSDLGLAGCFPTFMANSRSSQIPGSTLHDFALSEFEQCGASLVTTPSSTSFVIGGSVTDRATITVTGPNPPAPTGIVSFYLCGPTPGITTCPTTGTAFDTKNLSGATKVGNAYSVTSIAVTPTAPGDYCFSASWPGDLVYTDGPYSDTSATECFTVIDFASSLTSAQSFIPNDSATVSAAGGGALAGSVLFELFESTDCSGTAIYSQTVSVSGASPQTVSTTNTTVSTTAANVSWRLTYDSTNQAQRDIPATCLEKTALAINNDGTVSSP